MNSRWRGMKVKKIQKAFALLRGGAAPPPPGPAAAAAIQLPDGLRIELGELIGRGGSGVVYKGVLHERGGQREVAVKMLGQGASAKQQEAFLTVRALLGAFKHPLLFIVNRFVGL